MYVLESMLPVVPLGARSPARSGGMMSTATTGYSVSDGVGPCMLYGVLSPLPIQDIPLHHTVYLTAEQVVGLTESFYLSHYLARCLYGYGVSSSHSLQGHR